VGSLSIQINQLTTPFADHSPAYHMVLPNHFGLVHHDDFVRVVWVPALHAPPSFAGSDLRRQDEALCLEPRVILSAPALRGYAHLRPTVGPANNHHTSAIFDSAKDSLEHVRRSILVVVVDHVHPS